MSLQTMVPLAALLIIATVFGLVRAVGLEARSAALAVGMAFAAGAAALSLASNWHDLQGDRESRAAGSSSLETLRLASARNAKLMSAVYGWGGVAMFAVYSLTELFWYHYWQYGGIMLLVAAGLYFYAEVVARGDGFLASIRYLRLSAWASAAQAAAVLIGIGFIFASGKFAAGRADWAANVIFLSGGAALICQSLLAFATFRRISSGRGVEAGASST